MKRLFTVMIITCTFASSIFSFGCAQQPPSAPPADNGTLPAPSHKVKNVIVLIGDGMGPQAIGLLNAYAKYAESSIYKPDRVTWLERLMNEGTLGMVYHEAANVLVTDSAASATQIASGKWSLPETIGIDDTGKPVETMLDRAKALNKSTGLVSDTRLTHATPAAFAAHRTHRHEENEIAKELIAKQVDVLLSAGLRHFLPQSVNTDPVVKVRFEKEIGNGIEISSKREDDVDLIQQAKKTGYQTVFNQKALRSSKGPRLLGLFADSAFPYQIDFASENKQGSLPTLPEMTQKALEILSQNNDGYFLMVESGIIDWTEHDNDAGSLLHEMLRFDETLKTIYEFIKGQKETLLIVTADHETGGFSFSYTRRDIPKPSPFPGETYKDKSFKPGFNFGDYKLLDKIHSQKQSYKAIFQEFDRLTEQVKTEDEKAEILVKLVNENTEFPISVEEAQRVLAVEPNPYRVAGHGDLDRDTFPKVDDFEEFYVYGNSVRNSNLARVVGGYQNVVWSTGTHTSTPVPIIAWGEETACEKFSGLLHTTQWAQTVFELMEQ